MDENEKTKSYENPKYKLIIAMDNLIADVLLGEWTSVGDDRDNILRLFEEVKK